MATDLPHALDNSSGTGESERKQKRLRPHKREITMNLVAMLDMAFQLLIFFVLTANFAQAEGVLTANLPVPLCCSNPDPPLPPSMIRLRSNGPGVSITIETEEGSNGREDVPDFRTLTDRLRARLAFDKNNQPTGTIPLMRPKSVVLIVADADVAWQDVVNAFNAALNSGLQNVSLQPKPD